MEEKCVCSIQIWKEVFDHFDRQPKKIEINENYSIDESCKIIDADDEWIKICYTEKKDKQVVKLMRIENIESIEEQ